jgi:hypothetical protein
VLGWYVLIRREGADSPQDPPVARWETSVFGLDWLNDLVKADQAVDLVGNGYPNRYSVAAVSWRFNRRFQLNALVPCLLVAAVRCLTWTERRLRDLAVFAGRAMALIGN